MRDTRLRLLPYFQNIFALIAPTLYMLSLSKNCPNLNFHCPICQSHAIALLPGWQVCSSLPHSLFSWQVKFVQGGLLVGLCSVCPDQEDQLSVDWI